MQFRNFDHMKRPTSLARLAVALELFTHNIDAVVEVGTSIGIYSDHYETSKSSQMSIITIVKSS